MRSFEASFLALDAVVGEPPHRHLTQGSGHHISDTHRHEQVPSPTHPRVHQVRRLHFLVEAVHNENDRWRSSPLNPATVEWKMSYFSPGGAQ